MRVVVVAWTFAWAVLAGLVLRQVFGDATFPGRYTGYVMPWLLAGLVPGAILAGLSRRGALAALLGASAAWIVALHAGRFVPREPSPAADGTPVRVLSFNTWSKNGDADRIARLVHREAPDVLLLQETPPDVFARVVDALEGLSAGGPVHFAYEPSVRQAVVSRWPLQSRGVRRDRGQAQHVVVRSPAGPIAVFNVHPLRIGGWKFRYRQIAALLEETVDAERGPVILGGDLNANEHTELYRLLAGRLANAHDRAGSGLGFTYPAAGVRLLGLVPAPPLVRIDHLFFSAHFVARRAGTLDDAGGSDHRPVFAELVLRQGARPGAAVTAGR